MSEFSVLTFSEYYVPAFKTGGPVRTLANTIEQLGDKITFKVVTSDRDFEDSGPHAGITVDDWNQVGKAEVYYCSPRNRTISSIREIIHDTRFDILYLNSFFQPQFTIVPLILRRVGAIRNKPTVVAPRGEFSHSALELKKYKKITYINLARLAGLYRNVTWQASSVYEKEDIYTHFDSKALVQVAPNMPPAAMLESNTLGRNSKVPGRLRLFFLSRITPMKNLKWALENLENIEGEIEYDIYGPIHDKTYWHQCQQIISTLPSNITVRYFGAIPHDHVASTMDKYDLLFLPSRGENFGHVILEALAAGCPVIISNRTPWRSLESQRVGWDLPLEEPRRFRSVIQKCVDMNSSIFQEWSRQAKKYAEKYIMGDEARQLNFELFQSAISHFLISSRP